MKHEGSQLSSILVETRDACGKTGLIAHEWLEPSAACFWLSQVRLIQGLVSAVNPLLAFLAVSRHSLREPPAATFQEGCVNL